jgi:CRP-like cAMP-binding protein
MHQASDQASNNQESVSPASIKASPLGAELSDAQCATLAAIARKRRLGGGDFLLEAGVEDNTLHVVTQGVLEVVKQAGGGDWVTLKVIRPGEIVGELGFIDGNAHSTSIRALSATEAFSLQRQEFEALLATDPDLVYKVMRAIVRIVHLILRNMNYQYVEMTNYITKQHGRY